MNLRDAFDTPTQAIVLAEGEFGTPHGKTANGVVLQWDLTTRTNRGCPREIVERIILY